MRVDAYNQISQVYGPNGTTKAASTQATRAYGKDQFTVSQTARDYQVAKTAVAGASDVREDKVAALKAMVQSGTYKVDEGDFASKLLEKYNATIF